FFSSRRRHTRFSRDWSSDVCSSDLGSLGLKFDALLSTVDVALQVVLALACGLQRFDDGLGLDVSAIGERGDHFAVAERALCGSRSEERRVGKEGRCGGEAARYERE